MRFALWIAGAFFTLIGILLGWVPAVIAARSGDDLMVYGLAMQQVGAAATFILIGAVLIGAGCVVQALRPDGGKHQD